MRVPGTRILREGWDADLGGFWLECCVGRSVLGAWFGVFPQLVCVVLAITEKRIFLDVRREDWDSTFRKAGQVLLETTLSTTKRFTRYRCPNIPLGDVATEKSVGEP